MENPEEINGEKFKPLPWGQGVYFVGERGTIICTKTGKWNVIKPSRNGKYAYLRVNVYVHVRFMNGAKSPTKYVHKLVAETWVANPHGYNEVDHVVGDAANNHSINLLWVTRKENMRRAFAMNGFWLKDESAIKKRRKPIIVSKEQYGPGEEWESGRAWAIAQGNYRKAANVCTACKTGVNWYGLYFRYRDEPIPKPLVQVYEPVYVNAGCSS